MKMILSIIGGDTHKQESANKIKNTFKENNPTLDLETMELMDLYESIQSTGSTCDRLLIVNLCKDSNSYRRDFSGMKDIIGEISALLGKKRPILICDRNNCMINDYDELCIHCSNLSYHNFDKLTPTTIYTYVFSSENKSFNKNLTKQFNDVVSAKNNQILKNYEVEEAPIEEDEEDTEDSKGGLFGKLKGLFKSNKKSKPIEEDEDEAPVAIEEDEEDEEDSSLRDLEAYVDDEEPEEDDDFAQFQAQQSKAEEAPKTESPIIEASVVETPKPQSRVEVKETPKPQPVYEEPQVKPVEPIKPVTIDDMFGPSEPEPTVDSIVAEYSPSPYAQEESPYSNSSSFIEESPYSNSSSFTQSTVTSSVNATNSPVHLGEDYAGLSNVDSDMQADMYQYSLDRENEVVEAQNTANDIISEAQTMMETVKNNGRMLNGLRPNKKAETQVQQKETLRKLKHVTKNITPDEQILRQHRIVFVTGNHNSGVSSLVASLSYCAASMGKKVLNIDMDLINRTQSQIYENKNANSSSYSGLVAALNQWSSLQYYAYRTQAPGLSTLGVDITDGDNFSYRTTLNYNNFIPLLTNASRDYHLVIVDIPFEVLLANQSWVSVVHDVFYVMENDHYGIMSMLNKLCLENFDDNNSFFNTINKLSFVLSKFNDEAVFEDKFLDSEGLASMIEYYLGEDAVDYTSRKVISEIPYYSELCNQMGKHNPACLMVEEYKELCFDIIRNWS